MNLQNMLLEPRWYQWKEEQSPAASVECNGLQEVKEKHKWCTEHLILKAFFAI